MSVEHLYRPSTRTAVSFRDAERQAQQIAATLRRNAGTLPGSAVYLYARDSVQLVVTLLATQYCGARVCVLDRSFDPEEAGRLALRLQRGPLITDAQSVSGWPEKVLCLTEVAAAPGVPPAAADAAAGGILILTTGTTGTPKAAFYVWERLLAQVRLADVHRPVEHSGGASAEIASDQLGGRTDNRGYSGTST